MGVRIKVLMRLSAPQSAQLESQALLYSYKADNDDDVDDDDDEHAHHCRCRLHCSHRLLKRQVV